MAEMDGRRGHHGIGVFDVLLYAMVATLLACVACRYLLGMRAFSVITGSMTPTLAVGDLVIDVPVAYEDIKEGDLVTFVLNEDLDLATHRVVAKRDAERSLVTKGDANNEVDASAVDYRNVVGVVRLSVPRLGLVLGFLSTVPGKIAAVSAFALVMLVLMLVRAFLDDHADASAGSSDIKCDDAVAPEGDLDTAGDVDDDEKWSDDQFDDIDGTEDEYHVGCDSAVSSADDEGGSLASDRI